MITATFFKDSNGVHRGFSFIGHAGYGEHGSDIVCAAVSILAVNCVNSIEVFAKDEGISNVDEETGLLTFTFVEKEVSEKASLFIDSLILGINGIIEELGNEDYLQIIFKEV